MSCKLKNFSFFLINLPSWGIHKFSFKEIQIQLLHSLLVFWHKRKTSTSIKQMWRCLQCQVAHEEKGNAASLLMCFPWFIRCFGSLHRWPCDWANPSDQRAEDVDRFSVAKKLSNNSSLGQMFHQPMTQVVQAVNILSVFHQRSQSSEDPLFWNIDTWLELSWTSDPSDSQDYLTGKVMEIECMSIWCMIFILKSHSMISYEYIHFGYPNSVAKLHIIVYIATLGKLEW